ncbi:hypothetical protein [Agrococcus sp. Ld7]|uniref:hypothetical protein n=1 Tax=Agrococcus sp. Ld7 TaxID=649148 RepID=UPI003865D688
MRKTVPLHAVVAPVRSGVKPEQMQVQWQYILLEHISQGTGEVVEARVGDYEVKSAKVRFEAGDILYGKLRPQLRKCCVAVEPGACSTDIAPLRPLFDDSAYYLAAVLRSADFTQKVQRLVAGANLPRVNVRELLALEIPWPEEVAELSRRNRLAVETIDLRAEAAKFTADLRRLELSVTQL